MTRRQRKAIYYALEGANSFACAYHINYLFFLFRYNYHFDSRHNLLVSALHGLVYMLTAWYGGRFARYHGGLNALRVGFGGMGLALLAGLAVHTIPARLAIVGAWTFAMTFTWPTLQALISEGEDEKGLPRVVGAYNCIWAGVAGVAYFLGGAMFEGLGHASVYWLPAALYLLQFACVSWLGRQGEVAASAPPAITTPAHHDPELASASQPVSPQTFLRMAWLANPFSYIAINTALAIMPELSARLQLSVTYTGLFCSIWFFARFIAFIGLWRWTGWHYRFRWMVTAFIGLILGFTVLLLARHLWVLIAAQMIFGFSTGLLYYASLFYSMDVGEASSESGGVHESAVGSGIFLGPAIGAAAMQLAPGQPRAGVFAVGTALVLGFVSLVWMRIKGAKPRIIHAEAR